MSPHWIDAVLALTLLEGLALRWWCARAGARVPAGFWLGWLSGLCLMLALRGAVADWGAAWVLGWLSLSGLVHVTDLRRRWPRP